MGNLYRLNSLFELEINQFPKNLNFEKPALVRSAVLEYLFLAISKPKDFTIMNEPPSIELLKYWEKNKIQHGEYIEATNPYYARDLKLNKKIPDETNLIEWGNTSDLIPKKGILEKKNIHIARSQFRNSKINQTRWKESHKLNLLTSVICSDKLELEYAINNFSFPFVIKSEFGFSGTGNVILKTKEDAKDFLNKINKLLEANPKGVIVEEWVEERKIQDFSGLFELSSKKCELLATTKMLVDKNGVYRGSLIQKDFGKLFSASMNRIVKSYMHYTASYKGALSIDGFVFTEKNQSKIQYMSEINVRYSMGRILYEINKKFEEKNGDYALLFFPIKSKNLTFKDLIKNLSKLKTEFKSEIILLTPLTNSKTVKNPFLVLYVQTKKKFPMNIISEIKKSLL